MAKQQLLTRLTALMLNPGLAPKYKIVFQEYHFMISANLINVAGILYVMEVCAVQENYMSRLEEIG